MGSGKPYQVFGKISKEALENITPDFNGLWKDLVKRGYIDEDGDLLGKLFWPREHGISGQGLPLSDNKLHLEIDPRYKDCEDALKKILNKARLWSVAWEWIESILVAFVLAMIIRTFLFQPFSIPSGSMRMTLIEGDRLFVNKLDYGPMIPFTKYRIKGFGKPERGDVVVFKYPVTKDKDFIKRLIAFGGETVEIKDGKVLINGEVIDKGSMGAIYYYNAGDFGTREKPIMVPQGHYFVMGDNSGSSHDSRYWGFVPEDYLIGKAEVIFWPLNRIRWIK
ncbi:MAG: signal peptidase I [Candidatus Omnitrophica bacterium]|nr:signal peptidase I [Candidatus Omnitrophota bacterium]